MTIYNFFPPRNCEKLFVFSSDVSIFLFMQWQKMKIKNVFKSLNYNKQDNTFNLALSNAQISVLGYM